MRCGWRLRHKPGPDGRGAQSRLVRGGTRFRALERKAAAAPGTLFFIRPVYQDGTDRPGRFEAGVQDGENLLVEMFVNGARWSTPRGSAALRQSSAFGLDTAVVEECLDPASAKDRL